MMRCSPRTVGRARRLGKWLAAALCPAAVTAVAAVAAVAPALRAAEVSVLSLGPRGVQTLVAEQLFNRAGRWYLVDDEGVCYTYLEGPHVRLASERLVLKAHMVSRLGQRFGNNCVGADLASNVTVSGKIRGSEHQLILDDIRIDRVDDEAVRNALNLAVQLDPGAIPRTARIDILEALRRQAFTAGGFAVHVDEIHIAAITTRNDTLVIQFALGLSAP
jgi:hypothetical protein